MKLAAFWVIALYNLKAIALMMEAVRSSETLVYLYEITLRFFPRKLLSSICVFSPEL
jgi:hypothetical protein